MASLAKAKNFTFWNDTWLFYLRVRVGGDYAGACKWASKELGTEWAPEPGSESIRGTVFSHAGHVAMWIDSTSTTGIKAHEALHVAARVMRCKGVLKMVEDNEESFAYLVTWICDKMDQCTQRRKKMRATANE